jgi:hypothetical protein
MIQKIFLLAALLAALPPVVLAQASPAPDEACRQEVSQSEQRCLKEKGTGAAKRAACIERNLSPGCREHVARLEQARKACDEAVQRIWKLCKAESSAEKQAQCFERHRPEANAVCQ